MQTEHIRDIYNLTAAPTPPPPSPPLSLFAPSKNKTARFFSCFEGEVEGWGCCRGISTLSHFLPGTKRDLELLGVFFVFDCLQYLHTDIKLKSCSGPHLQREVKIMHRVSSLDCNAYMLFLLGFFFYLVMALKKYVLSCTV